MLLLRLIRRLDFLNNAKSQQLGNRLFDDHVDSLLLCFELCILKLAHLPAH